MKSLAKLGFLLSLVIIITSCGSSSSNTTSTTTTTTTTLTSTTLGTSTSTSLGTSTSTSLGTSTSTSLGTSSTSTTTSTTLALISGPSIGSGNNDADQVFRSLTVDLNDPNLVFVGTEGNGIFKTTDGGTTWTWQRQGLINNGSYYAEIYDMAIDPNNNNIIYAASVDSPGPPTGSYPSAIAGPYKSIDGGATWQRKVTGLSNSYTSIIATDNTNSNIVYLALSGGYPSFSGSDVNGTYFDGGIYKSTNSGESWSLLYKTSPANKNRFENFRLIDSDTLFTLGTNSDNSLEAIGLIKSTNAGANWSPINSPAGIQFTQFDVASQNPDIIYIGQRDSTNFYKSIDGGTNWSKINFYIQGPIKISPSNTNEVFFCGNEKLYRSGDGLQSWTVVLTGESYIQDIAFASSDNNIIYVACRNYLIYKSTNRGNSFSQIGDLRNYIDTH